jgi:5'-methylthioadenosine phosphorylase
MNPMKVDVGIIGGTGIGERLAALGGEAILIPTEAGPLRGRLLEVAGKSVLLVSRHSAGHKMPPHRVNYKAMALGLRTLGVGACFATAAVGGLEPDWPPGTMVVCSDFLDFTGRNLTLFDRQVVHTDYSQPFALAARRALLDAAAAHGRSVVDGGVYLTGNGPRYETPAEIEMYRKLGAQMVGMTASSEAILMREAGVPYAVLAVVTNMAAGMTDLELSHEEVVDEMQRSGEAAVELLKEAVRRFERDQ